jgi:hypothetical protein
MASLKFFNTSTSQWEIIKTDALSSVIPNNQTWTATTSQSAFTISNGSIPDAKLLNVYVDGKIRIDYTLTNSTTFTFFTGLTSGQQVYAEWFEVAVPATQGHHATHEANGQDAIDLTKLTNYSGLIGTPITNLQNTQTNHETRITTIESKNLDPRVSTLETAKTTDEARLSAVEWPYYMSLGTGQIAYSNPNELFQIPIISSNMNWHYGFNVSTNDLYVPEDGIYFMNVGYQASGLNADQTFELIIRRYAQDNVGYGDFGAMLRGASGQGWNNGGVPLQYSIVLNCFKAGRVQFFTRFSEAPRLVQANVNVFRFSK